MHAGPDCPRCHARLRADAPWCTQCYLDLRPADPPPPVRPETAPRRAARRAEPDEAGRGEAERRAGTGQDERTWPCTNCGAANALSSDTCAACGQGFLAPLREVGTPMLVLPLVGDVVALRPAQRLGLAGAVIALVALLTLLLGVLL